jgi:predicted transcriptional regulator
MGRRSRVEIIADVLRAAGEGATTTHIMCGSYLSYGQVQEYLKLLLRRNLLRYEEGRSAYRVTRRGTDFLSTSGEMREFVAMEGGESEGRDPRP